MTQYGPIFRRYALTVKRNGNKHCPLSEVDKTLAYIAEALKGKEYKYDVEPVFERDSRGTLHAHASVRTNGPFLYRRLQLKNWHIFFEELLTEKDLKKWQNYLKKEDLKVPLIQQSDAIYYYNHHNGFLEV